jgi:hypothetical protein
LTGKRHFLFGKRILEGVLKRAESASAAAGEPSDEARQDSCAE